MTKFRLGQIVKTKLGNHQVVIVKIFTFLRKQPKYLVSYGESPEIVKKENEVGYVDLNDYKRFTKTLGRMGK